MRSPSPGRSPHAHLDPFVLTRSDLAPHEVERLDQEPREIAEPTIEGIRGKELRRDVLQDAPPPARAESRADAPTVPGRATSRRSWRRSGTPTGRSGPRSYRRGTCGAGSVKKKFRPRKETSDAARPLQTTADGRAHHRQDEGGHAGVLGGLEQQSEQRRTGGQTTATRSRGLVEGASDAGCRAPCPHGSSFTASSRSARRLHAALTRSSPTPRGWRAYARDGHLDKTPSSGLRRREARREGIGPGAYPKRPILGPVLPTSHLAHERLGKPHGARGLRVRQPLLRRLRHRGDPEGRGAHRRASRHSRS